RPGCASRSATWRTTRSSRSTVRKASSSRGVTCSSRAAVRRRCVWCGRPIELITTSCAPSSAGARAREASMLRTLRVSDLAIIDEIELVFEPGFNVLTGETGAGKSILLHALDVALGGRPDADLVRSGAEEAVVEALFTGVPSSAWEPLDAAGIRRPEGDELVIRRVIAAGGRSRAYANGALANLALLRELAPHLVRVYGQDEHQALRRVEGHREMLDAMGGLGSTVEEMRRRHARFVSAKQTLDEQRLAQHASVERAELLRFQLDELTGANLQPGEDDALVA